jgi:hypothetical protein
MMENRYASAELSSAAGEERLRAYLANLEPSHSATATSPTAAEEWKSEAEQHLRSLIAAFEELGDSHEDAVRQALARFGNAPTLSRSMRRETRRQQRRRDPAQRVFDAISAAYGPSILPVLPFVAYAVLYDRDAPGQSVCLVLTRGACLLAPVLSGWALAGPTGNVAADLRDAVAERGKPVAAWCILSLFLLVALVHPGLEWTVIGQLSGESACTNGMDWRAAPLWPLAALAVAALRVRVVAAKRTVTG